ncbi:MAG: chemotaxis-specific protein-glutamate methyltransferase CheB [Desulfobacterales bacterium]|nr:chemotaxis-specific protein-glutamate methyltransferase CheB [Desulfobacterales bacterium]
MSESLKVLVVDDSVTYRQILSSVVNSIKGAELIGTAPNGKICLAKIELTKPDIVLLDVDMPVMNGLATLNIIKKDYPQIEVIMISGINSETASRTINALRAGALDFISKPKTTSIEDSVSELRSLLVTLFSIATSRKYTRRIQQNSNLSERIIEKNEKPFQTRIQEEPRLLSTPVESRDLSSSASLFKPQIIRRPARVDVVAIGVSTGGPNALMEIIPKLEAPFPVPILTVQHMPPLFTASLAEQISKMSAINVVEGADDQEIESGIMYIAPGGHHMLVRAGKDGKKRLGLSDTPPVNSCRPAVDVLFRSIALNYGANVLSVILTGMGNDGLAGVIEIRRKGGYSLVQDEKSSLIWGMPGAVSQANEADEVIGLANIAQRIMQLVRK